MGCCNHKQSCRVRRRKLPELPVKNQHTYEDIYSQENVVCLCCRAVDKSPVNQRSDNEIVGRLIHSSAEQKFTQIPPYHNGRDKSKCSTKRIIAISIIVIGIIIAITATILLRKVNKTNYMDDEDDVEAIPDPEVPPLPSPSKLRRFYGGGAVCADDVLCADIGKTILEKKGSAVDATIAASLCSGLGNMQAMGIGGGFVMTIYERSSGRAYYLNARDMAPLAAYPDMFRNKSNDASHNGALAIAVPGEIAGYWMAHERFGKLPWSDLFTDTIALCRRGWKLRKSQYDDLFQNNEAIHNDPTLRAMFMNETTNEFKLPGSLVKGGKLCDTLEIIATKGAREFYNGALGRTLIEDIQKHGGILTMKDLNSYTAKWEEPLVADLSDGMKLYTANFPGSGALLVFVLNILREYDFTADNLNGWNNTVQTYHRMIETFKYAYAFRSTMGDPNYVDMTELTKNLTSKEYARRIKAKISDKQTWNDAKHYGADDGFTADHGTAHLSIISPNGDAVSLTSSVNTFFGCGIVSERTGILLNSGMDDFSIPSVVNYFGLPGDNKYNLIESGKRPLSSMVPSIIVDHDDNVRMVIGSAGGTKITTSVAFVIARYLWMGNTIKEAIDAPRIHHQLFPMKMEYQFGVIQPVIAGLKALGHKTSRYRGRGSVVCALVQVNGTIYANADFRRAGDVSGIN